MTEQRPLIGFSTDAEHVLCPRCSTEERICCEMFQQDCEECAGDGWLETSEWDCGAYENIEEPCQCCQGRGWWWHCSCDAQGRHR